MSYSAPNRLLMPGRHSIDTLADSWLPGISVNTGAAWPSANLAIYVPLRVPSTVVVVKLWFASGATGGGNVDMGLYNSAGTAVISATEAAKGGAGEQVFDVTDTTIRPGTYYIALSSDSATATFYNYACAAPLGAAFGVLTETSAYPLPATATFARLQTLAFIPVCGLLIEATIA